MEFAQQQRNPAKHIVEIALVVVLHVGIIYALVNGLARRVVEVIRQPIETKIIEEVKPPPADAPPSLPQPMLAAPPPPYIPPPEVHIQPLPQQPNVITAVTNVKPAEPTPPLVVHAPEAPPTPPARPHEVVRVPPAIDAARSCQKPEYPPASRRLGEKGTVTLHMLIDVDGRAIRSEVVSSSHHSRLPRGPGSAQSLQVQARHRRWQADPVLGFPAIRMEARRLGLPPCGANLLTRPSTCKGPQSRRCCQGCELLSNNGKG